MGHNKSDAKGQRSRSHESNVKCGGLAEASFLAPLVWIAFLVSSCWLSITEDVSAEPFSHGTGTLRCLQKEMATYRHWSMSLWRDSDDVSHCRILFPDKTEWRLISATFCGLLNPVPWQNWMVAYLGYTLRMKTLFRGWPVMVNDTHTRRRRLKWNVEDVHTQVCPALCAAWSTTHCLSGLCARPTVWRIRLSNYSSTCCDVLLTSGVPRILSQVGHGVYVHEMRHKSQKFWHKHNKLENWTGSVFQFIMFVSKFLWFLPHFMNIRLFCHCPPYSRMHTLELNVSANVWSNCSTVLAVLAQ